MHTFIFPKFELVFTLSVLFHDQVLYFLDVFCWKNKKINIYLTILVMFQSRMFRKRLINFSNNTFPIKTGIINLFHYIWEIWFAYKNDYFSGQVETWQCHQKSHATLIAISGFFWKILCSTTLMQSFISRA